MSFNLDAEIKKLQLAFQTEGQRWINNFNVLVARINSSRISVQAKNTLIQQAIRDTQNRINQLLLSLNKQIDELKKKAQLLQQQQQQQQQPQQQQQIQLQIDELSKVVRRALLIGINYNGTSNQLYGCINDINNVEKKITSSFGFTEIIKLTDDTLIKPTRQNILDQMKNILNKSQKGDSIFIHFSGHGSQTLDRNNDENDGLDEVLVSMDLKGITDDEIKQLVQSNLKSGVKLFCLFDSCHSGTVLDLRYQYLDSDNFDKDTQNLKNELTPSTCIMISGCRDSQTSGDAWINRQAQGAMSWSFLEALNTSNKVLSWKQLLQKMRDLLRESTFEQIPQLSSGLELNINSDISF